MRKGYWSQKDEYQKPVPVILKLVLILLKICFGNHLNPPPQPKYSVPPGFCDFCDCRNKHKPNIQWNKFSRLGPMRHVTWSHSSFSQNPSIPVHRTTLVQLEVSFTHKHHCKRLCKTTVCHCIFCNQSSFMQKSTNSANCILDFETSRHKIKPSRPQQSQNKL